jgi:hypothetical protein
MAFLAPKTDVSPGSPNRQSHEVSGPVPVVLGRARIPMRLMEHPWNYDNDIDHGQRRPAGHAASLAYMGCHGPIDALYKLYINGHPVVPEHVWRPADGTASLNQGPGRLETFQNGRNIGKIFRYRVHWGTVEQEQDPFLNGQPFIPGSNKPPLRNPDGSARNHPPYAGLFYIVFEQLHFDDPWLWENDGGVRGSSSVPNIEAEVFVQPPWAYANDQYGVNPLAATREILRNPIWGADLPESIVPNGPWSQAAQKMNEEGYFFLKEGQGNLSPVLGTQRELAAHLADFFAIYDGFLTMRGGQLLPGWFPNMPGGDPGEITTIERAHCVEEPDIDPEGWEDTASAVAVTTRNLYERMEEETVIERSAYNRRITGRDVERTVHAPAIIQAYPRAMLAARELHRAAYPSFSAHLRVLPRQARNPDGSLLLPGDLVRLNYEPYALNLLCRVIEREDRPGRVRLSLQNERGRFPEDFVPQPEQREIPQEVPAAPLEYVRLFELTDELMPTRRPVTGRITENGWEGDPFPRAFLVLAQRPSTSILGARLDFSFYRAAQEEWSSTSEMDPLRAWASVATLTHSIANSSTGNMRFSPTGGFEIRLNRDFTIAERDDGYILAIIGNEIISLGSRHSQDNPDGVRRYNIRRGMFGTVPTSHASNSVVHFLRRSDIPAMTRAHRALNTVFAVPYRITTTAYTAFEEADAADPLEAETARRWPVALGHEVTSTFPTRSFAVAVSPANRPYTEWVELQASPVWPPGNEPTVQSIARVYLDVRETGSFYKESDFHVPFTAQYGLRFAAHFWGVTVLGEWQLVTPQAILPQPWAPTSVSSVYLGPVPNPIIGGGPSFHRYRVNFFNMHFSLPFVSVLANPGPGAAVGGFRENSQSGSVIIDVATAGSSWFIRFETASGQVTPGVPFTLVNP